MTNNKERLTEEQQELVSKNHNLIYAYAHKKNVSIDDYYDVLAIGLCKAAKAFDKNRGKFSTLAYRCMENELNLHWKSTKRKSVIPEELVFSYDAPINSADSDEDSFTKFITGDCFNSEVLSNIVSEEFVESLSDKEKDIISFLLDGMTHKEIADTMGFKRQNVSYHLNNIRKKANCLLS